GTSGGSVPPHGAPFGAVQAPAAPQDSYSSTVTSYLSIQNSDSSSSRYGTFNARNASASSSHRSPTSALHPRQKGPAGTPIIPACSMNCSVSVVPPLVPPVVTVAPEVSPVSDVAVTP